MEEAAARSTTPIDGYVYPLCTYSETAVALFRGCLALWTPLACLCALILLGFCSWKSLVFISTTISDLVEHTTAALTTYSLLAACKMLGPSLVAATWNLWGLWHGDNSVPPLPVHQPGVEDANWWDHYIYYTRAGLLSLAGLGAQGGAGAETG